MWVRTCLLLLLVTVAQAVPRNRVSSQRALRDAAIADIRRSAVGDMDFAQTWDAMATPVDELSEAAADEMPTAVISADGVVLPAELLEVQSTHTQAPAAASESASAAPTNPEAIKALEFGIPVNTTNCYPGTMCPMPNGHCCPPHGLLCCQYGCLRGLLSVRCRRNPRNPIRDRWDAEQMLEGERDYKEQIARIGLAAIRRLQQLQLEKEEGKKKVDTSSEQESKRDVAAATRDSEQIERRQKRTELLLKRQQASEESTKAEAKSLQLETLVVPMQNFRGPQYKLVGDLCHVGGSLQRQGGIIGDGKRATLLATFPEECRPSGRVVWHRNVDNAATCRVDVTQEGVLTAVSGPNSNWVSLESATIIPDKVKGSGIFLHSRWQPYGQGFQDPFYVKSGNFCVLTGVVRIHDWNKEQWNEQIGRLATDCRPDSTLVFNAVSGSVTHRVDVTPDGWITYKAGAITEAWISLDGIQFSIAMNSENALSLRAGWSSMGGPYRAALWGKMDNVCILSGVVQANTIFAPEPELVQRIPRTIAVIPVECRPASKLIFSTNANAKVLVVEIWPTGDLVWRVFTEDTKPTNIWISLDGIKYVAP